MISTGEYYRPVVYDATNVTDSHLLWPTDQVNWLLLTESVGTTTALKFIKGNVNLLKGLWPQVLCQIYLKDARDVEIREMARLNGEDTAQLADKYYFIEKVRQLGYLSPKQVSISPSQSSEERRQAITSAEFTTPKLYIKPRDNGNSIGIKVVESGDIDRYTNKITHESVVQEEIEVDQPEYRYIRVNDKKGNNWRVAFQRERPVSIGREGKSIRHLIKEDHGPLWRRSILTWNNKSRLMDRPSTGERVELSKVSNMQQGGYVGTIESPQRLSNLDRFMDRFIADLEESVGHKLNVLCFDVGIKDISTLDEEYDFETLRRNVVFFELQIPFDIPDFFHISKTPRKIRRTFRRMIDEI